MAEPLNDLVIQWDKPTVARFQRLIGKNGMFGKLYNWQYFFKTENDDKVIQNEIKENLEMRRSPDGMPWAPLSMAYQQSMRNYHSLGRSQMYISKDSPIFWAYVNDPIVNITKTTMHYMPNPARFSRRYDLPLRFGWLSRGGRFVPGREWFGVSEKMRSTFETDMYRYVNQMITEFVEGADSRVYLTPNPVVGLR